MENSRMRYEFRVKIKKIIKENLTNEMAQAFVKVFDTQHASLKVFWIISLVLTNALSSYLIIESFVAYFNYEVSTTSRNIFETPTQFPKITICNYNPFTTQYALEFLSDLNKQIRPEYDIFSADNLMNESLHFTAKDKSQLIVEMYSLAMSTVLNKNFSDDNRQRLGHSLEDVLFKCKFNNEPCTFKDFVWKFDRFYGNCYVFNSGNESKSIRNSLIAGSLFGLQLELYASFNQRLSVFNSPFGPGIYLRVENGSSPRGDTFNGIFLATGYITYVSVDRLFRHNLPRPYSSCDISATAHANSFDSDLYRLVSHSEYEYRQELCLLQW